MFRAKIKRKIAQPNFLLAAYVNGNTVSSTSFLGSLSYPSLAPWGRVGENPGNEVAVSCVTQKSDYYATRSNQITISVSGTETYSR